MASPEDAPEDTPRVRYLTIRQYSDEHQVHERTIKRWLSAGELPGAFQDQTTQWHIPADATRQPRSESVAGATLTFTPAAPVLEWPGQPGTQLAAVPPPRPETVDDRVEDLPTVMTVDEFVDVLNHGRPADDPIATKRGLINNAERFDLFKLTERGPWLVPLSTVKKLRGLAAG
jgi:hypothetical protein